MHPRTDARTRTCCWTNEGPRKKHRPARRIRMLRRGHSNTCVRRRERSESTWYVARSACTATARDGRRSPLFRVRVCKQTSAGAGLTAFGANEATVFASQACIFALVPRGCSREDSASFDGSELATRRIRYDIWARMHGVERRQKLSTPVVRWVSFSHLHAIISDHCQQWLSLPRGCM